MGNSWDQLFKTMVQVAGMGMRTLTDKGVPRETAIRRTLDMLLSLYPHAAAEDAVMLEPMISLAPSLGSAWQESAFATVEIGERLAASLACTSIPGELLGEIEMPWRCFNIRTVIGGERMSLWLLRSAYDGSGGQCRTLCVHGNGFHIHEEDSWNNYASIDLLNCDNNNLKARALIHGRIAVGALIELDTPQISKHIQRGPKHKTGRNARGEPKSWVFRLSRDVKLDLREFVGNFISGRKSGKLSVQQLVRGHHKRQRTGALGADRKWIHVEPYWRGDPDSPIALRTHKLGGHTS